MVPLICVSVPTTSVAEFSRTTGKRWNPSLTDLQTQMICIDVIMTQQIQVMHSSKLSAWPLLLTLSFGQY